jgi:hypothetical protein
MHYFLSFHRVINYWEGSENSEVCRKMGLACSPSVQISGLCFAPPTRNTRNMKKQGNINTPKAHNSSRTKLKDIDVTEMTKNSNLYF